MSAIKIPHSTSNTCHTMYIKYCTKFLNLTCNGTPTQISAYLDNEMFGIFMSLGWNLIMKHQKVAA